MHSTMYQRFRLTPSKARAVVLWGLTVPVLTYYAAKYTDVSAQSPYPEEEERRADTEILI